MSILRTHLPLGWVVAGGAVFCALGAQGKPERDTLKVRRIEVEQFVLRDEEGKPRVGIGMDKRGSPYIDLHDALGRPRVQVREGGYGFQTRRESFCCGRQCLRMGPFWRFNRHRERRR